MGCDTAYVVLNGTCDLLADSEGKENSTGQPSLPSLFWKSHTLFASCKLWTQPSMHQKSMGSTMRCSVFSCLPGSLSAGNYCRWLCSSSSCQWRCCCCCEHDGGLPWLYRHDKGWTWRCNLGPTAPQPPDLSHISGRFDPCHTCSGP